MQIAKHIFLVLSFLAVTVAVNAQKENKYIRRGNSDFNESNFDKAEENYLRALNKGDTYRGLFNLGDVYYERNDYRSAGALFDSVASLPVENDIRSQAFYNLGNALLSASLESDSLAAQALPLSIESYKQSLRLNPVDTSAKYNLAYAQMLLEDQQQQQQQNQQNQQNQNQDQQQDQQNQDQQNQDQNEDQQDQEQQDQQQQNQQQDQQKGNPEQQQQQQQQPKQISKEDAERMLEAMKNDEKKTLEKVKMVKMKGKVVKSEKDW